MIHPAELDLLKRAREDALDAQADVEYHRAEMRRAEQRRDEALDRLYRREREATCP